MPPYLVVFVFLDPLAEFSMILSTLMNNSVISHKLKIIPGALIGVLLISVKL